MAPKAANAQEEHRGEQPNEKAVDEAAQADAGRKRRGSRGEQPNEKAVDEAAQRDEKEVAVVEGGGEAEGGEEDARSERSGKSGKSDRSGKSGKSGRSATSANSKANSKTGSRAGSAKSGGQKSGGSGRNGRKAYNEVDSEHFDLLHHSVEEGQAIIHTWKTICNAAGSRDAVGEAIFTAVFDAGPALQALFKSPKAVTSVKLAFFLENIINSLDDLEGVKVMVQDLAFRHLMFDITLPRIATFRDAITDLLEIELGDHWSQEASVGWTGMLNYCAGAMMYIKSHFAGQLDTLNESWQTIRDKCEGSGAKVGEKDTGAVPTSFDEMVHFNATVMGCSNAGWLDDILGSWDVIVRAVANASRLQEECEVVALRLSKHPQSLVDLSVFKACMLASLRSLLPRQWDSAHEVAWLWLWENVEKIVKTNMLLPAGFQKQLEFYGRPHCREPARDREGHLRAGLRRRAELHGVFQAVQLAPVLHRRQSPLFCDAALSDPSRMRGRTVRPWLTPRRLRHPR